MFSVALQLCLTGLLLSSTALAASKKVCVALPGSQTTLKVLEALAREGGITFTQTGCSNSSGPPRYQFAARDGKLFLVLEEPAGPHLERVLPWGATSRPSLDDFSE